MAGLSRYQFMGSDLSSDPRMGMDPRSRALASNRDPLYSTYGRETRRPRPGEESILDPERSPSLAGARNIDEMLRQADQGQVPQRDMYTGPQPQPAPMPPQQPAQPGGPAPQQSRLLELLRQLGIL